MDDVNSKMTTDNQQPDTGSGKPATIKAAEFVANDYAGKIARGECVVKNPLYSREEIISIGPIPKNSAGWDVVVADTRSNYRTFSYAELTVTWLPVTPAAETPTAGEAAITWADLPEKEQIALQTWVNVDRVFVSEIEKSLQSKGLTRIVRIDHNRHQNMYTDLGRSVLKQSTDDSWKFRKVGAGGASLSLDYRETLSREGLLEYLKEREVQFDEVYQQEYDKRSGLVAELATLRSQLAAAHEATAEAVRDNGRLRAAMKESLAYCRTFTQSDANAHMSRVKWLDMMRNYAARELASALAPTDAANTNTGSE